MVKDGKKLTQITNDELFKAKLFKMHNLYGVAKAVCALPQGNSTCTLSSGIHVGATNDKSNGVFARQRDF